MEKPYADLTLYCASSWNAVLTEENCGEGELTLETSDKRQRQRYYLALEVVMGNIRADSGISIALGSLAESEDDAQNLVGYIKKIFPGAESMINLYAYTHGSIAFGKHVLIPGWSKDREQELIDILKESGHQHRLFLGQLEDYLWKKNLIFL
ncbi:MAG: hypothetical protein KAT77_04380 [Nanoarchaeota archaeon]|nr:hypothetical protein [Nanoarchaeota archaeon]